VGWLAVDTERSVIHSEQIDQLAEALIAIQAAVPAIPKDANNPFFKSKYADLPAVVETAAPIITQYGVAVIQTVGFDGEHDTLTNLVVHKSGQWVSDTMRLHLPKQDPQGQGSAITYARRYAYMASLGLVADEDDDGNAASKTRRRPQQKAAGAIVDQDAGGGQTAQSVENVHAQQTHVASNSPAPTGPLSREEIERMRQEAAAKKAS
jgi:hypothetical protein